MNFGEIDQLYKKSLKYRLQDAYDLEKEIVDRALTIDSAHGYFQARKKWHGLSIFEKYEQRQPLHLPRNSHTTPSRESLDQLVFVSAADSRYFELLVELIESIQATRLYTNIPICVLDCGLTEDQKSYLFERSNVSDIKDPGWDVEMENYPISGRKAIVSKAFLSKHFPKYRYYFWIDADAWIQDERSLDMFINHAQEYGIGITQTGVAAAGHTIHFQFTDLRRKCIAKEYLNDPVLDQTYGVSVGAFCIDNETEIFSEWQKVITKNIRETRFNFFADTDSCGITCAFFDFKTLARYHHHGDINRCSKGVFLYQNTPMGIIALAAKQKWNRYQIDFETVDVDLEIQDSDFLEFSKLFNKGSIAWRVPPWRDKRQLQLQYQKLR